MNILLKNITYFLLFQIILIQGTNGQQISADQIRTKLKAATVLISNNGKKISAFFIADRILLTDKKATDDFIGTTMELNLDNTIITVNFDNITPVGNLNDWTLIKLSGQNIAGLRYEILSFADQIPAYPSTIYTYIPFSDFVSTSINGLSTRTFITEFSFCKTGRVGVPIVNNKGHVFGFFPQILVQPSTDQCMFLELISFVDIFKRAGAKIITTPSASSNTEVITSTIHPSIRSRPKATKIDYAQTTYIVLFISPKHFVIPKSFLPNSSIYLATTYINNVNTNIKFKKVYEDPFSDLCIMKVSFPSDFTFNNVPLSSTPVTRDTRVFSNIQNEDYVRDITIDQNGTLLFTIGGYHFLNSYVFDNQGQLIGLVSGEKNGRVIIRDLAVIRPEIMQAMTY